MILNLAQTTDSSLLVRLRLAAKNGVSAAELHSQRVSFIVSSLNDEDTRVTTEMVEAELNKLSGNAA